MAYQNVGTPRFYIDYLTYWHSIGYIQNILVKEAHGASLGGDKFFIGLDPASPTTFTISDEGDDTDQMALGVNFPYQQYLPIRVLDSINYMGVLGHDLQGFSMNARAFHRDSADAELGQHDETGRINNRDVDSNETEIINAEYNGLAGEADAFNTFNNNGFSLFQVDGYESGSLDGIDRLVFLLRQYDASGNNVYNDANPLTGSWNINSITLGHFYDMPVSADLKLNMEIEFDGYDQIDTTGGSTLTNVRYTGSPQWGNNNPWEIGDSNPIYKRNGRRTWSMKFSYISDKNLFASNYSSNTFLNQNSKERYDHDDLDIMNYGEVPILNKDFDNWTDTDPDDWRVFANESSSFTQTSTTKIEESTTGVLRFLQDWSELQAAATGSAGNLTIQPKVSSENIAVGGTVTHHVCDTGDSSTNYRMTINLTAVTTGTCRVRAGGQIFDFTTAGVKTIEFSNTSQKEIRITSNGADADFKITSFKLEKANPSIFEHTLMDDDSFIAKVLNFVGNGQRFIFQADNTNNNPDQFAICVLDQDSLRISQVAFKTYNISLKIREVW